MAKLRIRRGSESTPTLTLELEGQLDAVSALRLRDALEATPAADVTVDFSRIRDFQDAAVAVLSPALQGRTHRLLGLGPHQARVCRCFGLTADEPGRAGQGTATAPKMNAPLTPEPS